MAKATKENLVRNPLIQKIIASSNNDLASRLDESVVINNKDNLTLKIYGLNTALSGELDGHYESGLLQIAGPSRHFKTLFGLILAKSYLDKYPDAVLVLFDSEGGASLSYFKSVGIDTKRVVHIPVNTIEELKVQSSKILKDLVRGDKVFLFVDSVGNLGSLKELEDAQADNIKADVGNRAKAIKSFTRIITPQIKNKDLYFVAINHTIQTLEMFSKTVATGGTGMQFPFDDIWFISRSQEKETSGDKKLLGYNFTITIEKSRTVKEKSKIPVYVDFKEGIDIYSGLQDLAIESGHIEQPTSQSYQLKGRPETKCKKEAINTLLAELVVDDDFKEYIKTKFKLAQTKLINEDDDALVDEED